MEPISRFAEFELDEDLLELRRAGIMVDLRPKALPDCRTSRRDQGPQRSGSDAASEHSGHRHPSPDRPATHTQLRVPPGMHGAASPPRPGPMSST